MYDTFYLFFIVLLKRDRDKNDRQAMDIMEHANLVHNAPKDEDFSCYSEMIFC